LPWEEIFTRSVKYFGIFWPLRAVSSGLGSSRSTWLGPPCWNSWMTALARAGKWPCDGATAAARAFSSARSVPSARPAKPAAVRLNSSRRESRSSRWAEEDGGVMAHLSGDVDELVAVEQDEGGLG